MIGHRIVFLIKNLVFEKSPPIARFYISQNSINLNDELRVNFSKTRFFIKKRMRWPIINYIKNRSGKFGNFPISSFYGVVDQCSTWNIVFYLP